MTTPINSRQSENGRVYTWPPTGEEFPSVTTVISNGIPKPFLTTWVAKRCVQTALENLPLLLALQERSRGI